MPVRATNTFGEQLLKGLKTWVADLKVAEGADLAWVLDLERQILTKYFETQGVSEASAVQAASKVSEAAHTASGAVLPTGPTPGVGSALEADLRPFLRAALEGSLEGEPTAPEPAMPEDEFRRQIVV